MKRLIPFSLVAALALFAWLLAATPSGGLPQVASGGDFLSVLLGDAKTELSQAMMHEADSYFHGGIDMECHELHAHGDGKDCHCGEDDHGNGNEVHDEDGFDPWRWINLNVRAPEIERHLEGDRTIETMPWFWMAIKSDPHNVEAWSTAWYVALHMMKDDLLALRIAEEGCRQNPKSIEMACVMGRTYRAEKTFDREKSVAMFEEALKIGKEKEKITEHEVSSLLEALGYLAEYAEKRKDVKYLRGLLDVAKGLAPNHMIVKSIEKRIDLLKRP